MLVVHLVIMTLDFGERRSDLISRHLEAFDENLKLIRVGGDRNLVLLFAYEEAHGIKGKLKFGRGTNKAGPNRLFNPLPVKLDCQELIVVVRLCFISPTRFDVATVI